MAVVVGSICRHPSVKMRWPVSMIKRKMEIGREQLLCYLAKMALTFHLTNNTKYNICQRINMLLNRIDSKKDKVLHAKGVSKAVIDCLLYRATVKNQSNTRKV